jgi:uncharacterized membrane protein
MEPMILVDVLSRWIHVGTAIVIVGGSFFMRFVLMPAAEGLPEAEHDALRGRLMQRWRRFVGLGIGLFLLSGFYNFAQAVPAHMGDSLYLALRVIKILIAFGVFFLASALTGRAAAFEGIRRNRKKWLAVTILLAAVVVAIAGYLKVARKPTSAENSATTAAPGQANHLIRAS